MNHPLPESTIPAREPHFVLIIRAALTLPETFTKADLVIAAWKAYPHEFGMRTYDLPNSQAVYCKVDGATGLVGRGYLEWVEAGVLRATAAGHKFAAKPVATEPRATYAELRASLAALTETLRTGHTGLIFRCTDDAHHVATDISATAKNAGCTICGSAMETVDSGAAINTARDVLRRSR